MTTVERVKKARNQRDAMLEIAYAIDQLLAKASVKMPDPWEGEGWPTPEEPTGPGIQQDGDIVVPAPDEEQLKTRAQLARDLNLEEAFADEEFAPVDAFLRGGAYWLYVVDRDLVLSYPFELRQRMVDDIATVDSEKAAEVGRDILKDQDSIRPSLNTAGVGVR